MNMKKTELLHELRYLIARPEIEDVTEKELYSLLAAVKEMAYKDKIYPVFLTGNFRCQLDGVTKEYCRIIMMAMDNNHKFPSRETLDKVMNYYEVFGFAWYSFVGDGCLENDLKKPVYLCLRVMNPDAIRSKPTPFSPRQARMLNLKTEGKTQKEIAAAEKCSVTTVADRLHRASRKANRYGFWQIWPDSVEMCFSDEEYAMALKARGRTKK